MIKTLMIFDQCGQAPIKFYVLNGDYSHLDGIYVNHSQQDQKLVEELANLLYDAETGEELLESLDHFPYGAVSREHAKVIVAGFLA